MSPMTSALLISAAIVLPMLFGLALMVWTIALATEKWRERRRIRRSLKRLAQAYRLPRPPR